MTPDRYVAPSDLTPDALRRIWRSIPAAKQEKIGVLLLTNALGEVVAEDDGLIANDAARDAACTLHQDAFQELFRVLEASLPQVLWSYPSDYWYEARDRHDNLLGKVEHAGGDHYRYRPASSRLKTGRKVCGQPIEALPRQVRKAVDAGGWFGAIIHDKQYPDDFRPLINDDRANGAESRPCVAARPGLSPPADIHLASGESIDERAA